jgi:DNA-directed RNA polymerase subunit N (RpoN/RPB10)
MIIPIRCYTCNKLIADKYLDYKTMIQDGKLKPQEILEKKLNLHKYCCKRMLAYHADLISKIH